LTKTEEEKKKKTKMTKKGKKIELNIIASPLRVPNQGALNTIILFGTENFNKHLAIN